jgi:phosphoglycolate phosphatase-like HAD superfamily hydrolase
MYVCLFDIDGTLISSGGAGKAALELAVTTAFGLVPQTEKLQLSGRTDRIIVRDLLRMHALEDSVANWQRLREAYLTHLPECLSRIRGRVLPGIAALLEQLRPRDDVAVGLLTGNIRAGAHTKLSHYRLAHHFAFGGYGDQYFDRDDVAREAWAEVQQRFNGAVPPERVWVIGDTPLDVQCARAIGARVVAVGTGWHPLTELAAAQPDLLLPDLADPEPLLQRWR